jgi:hypothetical protein
MDGRNIEITEKQKEMIINFGAFHYEINKMAVILGMDEKEVAKMLKNKTSLFFKLYQEGKIKADYLIDKKLFELSKAGDLKALEEFEYRKQKNEN